MIQHPGNFNGNIQSFPERKRAAVFPGFEGLFERLTLHEFHDDVGIAIRIFRGVQYGYDSRVRQAGRDAGLTAQALAERV